MDAQTARAHGRSGTVTAMSMTELRKTSIWFACLAAAVALTACGDDSDDDAPTAADIPPSAVALVGDEPITKAELKRGQATLSRLNPQLRRPRNVKQLREQAMASLIQQTTLEQEAQEQGVNVSAAAARRRLEQAKRRFPDRRDYERFLGRQTEEDLLASLRAQLIGEKVFQRLREGESDSKKVLSEFNERWRERTACRPGYVVPACGNATAPPSRSSGD
jgi:hypothetical protein